MGQMDEENSIRDELAETVANAITKWSRSIQGTSKLGANARVVLKDSPGVQNAKTITITAPVAGRNKHFVITIF